MPTLIRSCTLSAATTSAATTRTTRIATATPTATTALLRPHRRHRRPQCPLHQPLRTLAQCRPRPLPRRPRRPLPPLPHRPHHARQGRQRRCSERPAALAAPRHARAHRTHRQRCPVIIRNCKCGCGCTTTRTATRTRPCISPICHLHIATCVATRIATINMLIVVVCEGFFHQRCWVRGRCCRAQGRQCVESLLLAVPCDAGGEVWGDGEGVR